MQHAPTIRLRHRPCATVAPEEEPVPQVAPERRARLMRYLRNAYGTADLADANAIIDILLGEPR